jgi:hypothetical protein
MAERRRNPYRPGTASYARLREADLRRRAALGRLIASVGRTRETRRRGKQRASAAQRAIREIETREEYRSKLSDTDRASYDRLSIADQKRLQEIERVYPDSIPKDLPDPFVGRKREPSWQLYYATRAGIRLTP